MTRITMRMLRMTDPKYINIGDTRPKPDDDREMVEYMVRKMWKEDFPERMTPENQPKIFDWLLRAVDETTSRGSDFGTAWIIAMDWLRRD